MAVDQDIYRQMLAQLPKHEIPLHRRFSPCIIYPHYRIREVVMSVLRRCLLLLLLLSMPTWSAGSYAAEGGHMPVNKHAQLLQGTWAGAAGEITFAAHNIVIYKGKRYLGAVASGTIQLSKKRGSRIIPYRISDDKLILTVDGNQEVYSRQ